MRSSSSTRLEWFIKSGAALLAVILVLLTLNSLKLLARTRGYLEGELEARLMNLKDILAPELETRAEWKPEYYSYLRMIAERESLDRIRLMGQDGRILSDSDGGRVPAPPVQAMGIPEARLKDVTGGLAVISPIYKSDAGLVRALYFPLVDRDGRIIAICELTLSAEHIEDLTELGTTHFMLKSLAVILIILGLLYMLRRLLASQRKIVLAATGANVGPERASAGDDVTFVISSFQTVVNELREKERELRELKDRAEEKARLIESYNENVLRSVQSGVVTFDVDGMVKTLNPAAMEVLGLRGEASEGRHISKVLEGGPWLCGIVDASLKEARVRRRGEGVFVTADGLRRWLGAGSSPMVDDQGSLMGAILVFTDLTEVRQLRERMELQERMTLIGEMSAGIAHELRNPMAVISGYARLLARRLGKDPESLEAVESMQEEISGMDDIIREFMNFARPTELNLGDIDVVSLLEDAARAAGVAAEDADIRVEAEDGMPALYGDSVLLRQAFINIINNGMESMENRGVLSVRAAMSEPSPDEDDAPAGERLVRVDFTDTGRGIPEEDMKKIFTPFYTTKSKGTGLGLALVQKILVHHGGKVVVKSEPGHGTTFTVYLPVRAHGEMTHG